MKEFLALRFGRLVCELKYCYVFVDSDVYVYVSGVFNIVLTMNLNLHTSHVITSEHDAA